jgi:hypothetical protein
MATEGFGASFGNPSKYMGSSPLSDIGSALKAFGVATAIEKSGAKDWLNSIGIKQNAEGKFGIKGSAPSPTTNAAPVTGAIPPTSQPMGGPLGDSYHPGTGVPLYFDRSQTQPVSMPLSTPSAAPMAAASTSVGNDVLDGNFHGVSMPQSMDDPLNNPSFKPQSGYQAPQTSGFTTPEAMPVPAPNLMETPLSQNTSLKNPDDYDPRKNYGYTEQLASGNEYTQQPGYGKTKKLMSSLFGMA